MDNRYVSLEWRPELERPVLIAAFTGWNDAAEAASVALSALRDSWEARDFGVFDAEEFFDYQAARPQIKLIELARELDVELVVTMGALLADVPHSRPVSVAANSQDPALVESLGLSASRYEGPTGITGVLHRACAEAGLPSVSFWAPVPHYLPAVPSAPAALALLESLSGLLRMDVDTSDLERGAAAYQEQVSAAVSQDSDLTSYVRMLEDRFDSQVDQGPRNLPTGDDLARELESFLREERREEE